MLESCYRLCQLLLKILGKSEMALILNFRPKGDFHVAQLIWVDYERGWCCNFFPLVRGMFY